jgi:RNA recognition motif-containing protein
VGVLFFYTIRKGTPVNIYVGNLSYEATEDDLRQAFSAYGQVSSVSIITDRDSGRSRGFGFVEMPVQAEAEAAIRELNGQDLKGRDLTVNMARPREQGGGGRGGSRGGGQRGGRGGGDRRRSW